MKEYEILFSYAESGTTAFRKVFAALNHDCAKDWAIGFAATYNDKQKKFSDRIYPVFDSLQPHKSLL